MLYRYVAAGVAGIRADLDEFDKVSQEMAEPDCDMDELMERMGKLQVGLALFTPRYFAGKNTSN
jgi:hypothetical protein